MNTTLYTYDQGVANRNAFAHAIKLANKTRNRVSIFCAFDPTRNNELTRKKIAEIIELSEPLIRRKVLTVVQELKEHR